MTFVYELEYFQMSSVNKSLLLNRFGVFNGLGDSSYTYENLHLNGNNCHSKIYVHLKEPTLLWQLIDIN